MATNTSREHIAKAEHNLLFAEMLPPTAFVDWAITAYFYSALHWVEALLLAKEGIESGRHRHRREFTKTKAYLKQISTEYRTLQGLSENARYDLMTVTSIRVANEIVPLYEAIRKHIQAELEKITTPVA